MSDAACKTCPFGAIQSLERKWRKRLKKDQTAGCGEFQHEENHRGALLELERCIGELSDLTPPPSYGPPDPDDYDHSETLRDVLID